MKIHPLIVILRYYNNTMGVSKTFHFSAKQNALASLAKAFAHPARIAIIQKILENKTCIVGDLSQELPLSQSTISQHIKELKGAGILKGEIEGPSVCYCIDEKNWKVAKLLLSEFLDSIDHNCC